MPRYDELDDRWCCTLHDLCILSRSHKLKSRLHLLLDVLQSPVAPAVLTPHTVGLSFGEALRLNGWIVPEFVLLADLLRGHSGGRLAICTLVDGDDDSTSKAEVVLKSSVCAVNETVVRPSCM